MFHMLLIVLLIITTERVIGTPMECEILALPENGFFIGGYCSNQIGSACFTNCNQGYNLSGSALRQCMLDDGAAIWTGKTTKCEIVKCKPFLNYDDFNLRIECSKVSAVFGTLCHFYCGQGFSNSGSEVRKCLEDGQWSGIAAKCTRNNSIDLIVQNSTTKQSGADPINLLNVNTNRESRNIIKNEDTLKVSIMFYLTIICTILIFVFATFLTSYLFCKNKY